MFVCRKLLAGLLLGLYLGLSDGYLAIFKSDQATPVQALPYSQELFTEADRAKLKSGIPFSTDKELHRLLEDFTS